MDALSSQEVVGAIESGGRLVGRWYHVNCMFCPTRVGKEDRDRTLHVHAESGGGKCHRCGMKVHVELPESLRVEGIQQRDSDAPAVKMGPPEAFVELGTEPGRSARSLAPAREYMLSRGLDSVLWREARVGACSVGPLANRVVVPVLAEDGSWLGYSARLWTAKCDKKLKYRNAVGEWKAQCLYNAAALGVETDEPLYVVEGCFDALALWPNAVAVLGEASPYQVYLLCQAKRPLVVVMDGDAHSKGEALAIRLQFEGVRAGAVRLAAGRDPDEVDRAWLRREALASLAA